MLHNPLVHRYWFSAFRPPKLQLSVIMYVILLALGVFINVMLWQRDLAYGSQSDCFRGIFVQLILFQILLWWIVGGCLSSSAFKDEVLAKTHDFFRLLPLTPFQKMTGVIVGKNLQPLLFGLCNLPFLFFFGCGSGVPVSFQIQLVFFILSATVFFHTVPFLTSMSPAAPKEGSSLFVFLIVIIIGVLATIRIVIQGVIEFVDDPKYVTFFTLRIPLLIFLGLQAWYWGIWAALGILRRFKWEYEPLMTLKAGIVFYIGYEVILIGLMAPHCEKSQAFLYVFWLLSFIPVFLLPLGMIREFNQYLEFLGSLDEKVNSNYSGLLMLGGYSFIPKGIVFFTLWGLWAVSGILWTGTRFQNNLYAIGALFSFYLVYLLYLELYVVYKTVASNAGLLLFFLGVLYLIMPLILAGLFENPKLMVYSPVGFLVYPTKPSHHFVWICDLGVWIQNITLTLLAVLLILRRYRKMLEIRRTLLLSV